MRYQMKSELMFPWHFLQRFAHSVMSFRASLPIESAWICICIECTNSSL